MTLFPVGTPKIILSDQEYLPLHLKILDVPPTLPGHTRTDKTHIPKRAAPVDLEKLSYCLLAKVFAWELRTLVRSQSQRGLSKDFSR